MTQSGVWVFWMHGYSILDRDESQVFGKAHRKCLAFGRVLGEGERTCLGIDGSGVGKSLDKGLGEILGKALSEVLAEDQRTLLSGYGEKIGSSNIRRNFLVLRSPIPSLKLNAKAKLDVRVKPGFRLSPC